MAAPASAIAEANTAAPGLTVAPFEPAVRRPAGRPARGGRAVVRDHADRRA